MNICIDFDGTICPNKGCNDSLVPGPSSECLYVLKRLKESGHKLIIYSVRSNDKETNMKNGHSEMIDYLNCHGIEYDEIHIHKPHFNLIIDDKSCGGSLDQNKNVDWKEVLKELKDKDFLI